MKCSCLRPFDASSSHCVVNRVVVFQLMAKVYAQQRSTCCYRPPWAIYFLFTFCYIFGGFMFACIYINAHRDVLHMFGLFIFLASWACPTAKKNLILFTHCLGLGFTLHWATLYGAREYPLITLINVTFDNTNGTFQILSTSRNTLTDVRTFFFFRASANEKLTI